MRSSASSSFVHRLLEGEVPAHRHTRWYLSGTLVAYFFLIQALSGILLTLYYQPAPDAAHESVGRIIGGVPFGWLVRTIHVWCSSLLVLSATVHLGAKYFLRTYRHPHSSAWRSGLFLLLLLLAFAFTGHLLPWDVTGYYATEIGAGIAASAPVVGGYISEFLLGGGGPAAVNAGTLTRIYSLHTAVLPFLTLLLAGFYLVRKREGGWPVPEGVSVEGGIRLYPDFAVRVALACVFGTMILLTLSLFFPVDQGPRADVSAPAPPGIRPEWYFLPVFHAIRILPGSIAGVNTETILTVVIAGLLVWLMTLPRLDRGNGRLLRAAGIAFLLYCLTAIVIVWTGL